MYSIGFFYIVGGMFYSISLCFSYSICVVLYMSVCVISFVIGCFIVVVIIIGMFVCYVYTI